MNFWKNRRRESLFAAGKWKSYNFDSFLLPYCPSAFEYAKRMKYGGWNLASRKRRSSMEEERHRLFSREEEHRKEGFFVRFVAVEQTVGHLHRRSTSSGFPRRAGERRHRERRPPLTFLLKERLIVCVREGENIGHNTVLINTLA